MSKSTDSAQTALSGLEKAMPTMDPASRAMARRVKESGIAVVWDRLEAQQPQCGFGSLGLCCTVCHLGPCRIDPFGNGPRQGVCGATAEIIASRNLLRDAAAGSACHSDHGRHLAHTLMLVGEGKAKSYEIRDSEKLRKVSAEFGIVVDGATDLALARELGSRMLAEFGRQDGGVLMTARAPQRQKEIWQKLGILPRGIDREVVEAMAKTNMGVDNDPDNILLSAMRVSLSDGWGGSMIATDASDILFGAPQPIKAQVNLGVLQADQVNILLHGHVPILSDVIVSASRDPEMLALAKEKGASGINVAGICCTANEILVRRGIPVAGNFLQQELALATGVVDAMIVDVQCIMPSLGEIAKSFHTKVISTDARAKFPWVEHMELVEEDALPVAKKIVRAAVENYANRDDSQRYIPNEKMDLIAGFTTENIFYNLGGRFRASYRPLNDAIISGRIRGVAGVVGCDSPKNQSGGSHVEFVKELIKHDVLVVQTGCSAISCAKAGLLKPESALQYAGKGLQEICEAVGIPPVLHSGSCVDNSRILTACIEMVREGGIGKSFDELPVAGAAPEWYSEKAIAIAWYVVASGIFTVLGSPFKVQGSKLVEKMLTEGLTEKVGASFAFERDPIKGAHLIIEHINRKRDALKLAPMMYGSGNGKGGNGKGGAA
jgi:anaerobic carbon-monoxide dehydrogenase catalytic subunit